MPPFFGQLIEFALAHYLLVSAFFVVLGALIVTESHKSGKTVSLTAAVQMMNKSDAVVLDVRPTKEYKEGHILNAINIPLVELKKRITELEVHREKPVIVVCAVGQHAGMAGKELTHVGFNQVVRLDGGMNTWRTAGLPVIK